jgi:GNAT superfamily N-acetyltransferase
LSRNPVHVRDARPDDAEDLLGIWSDSSRRTHALTEPPEVEAAAAIARVVAACDERLIVAEVEGIVVGAAHLRRSPLSPIHNDSAIHVSHLHVLDAWRRRGVGRLLMEAAVSWAEEKDTSHVLAAASASSRDANRFMARLGLAQIAVVRGATVAAVRAKMPVEAAACARVTSRSSRNVGQVLARRRSQRRSQAKTP